MTRNTQKENKKSVGGVCFIARRGVNFIYGVPGCANRYTETDILKNEWGYDGFIESDYKAVAETRSCSPWARTGR